MDRSEINNAVSEELGRPWYARRDRRLMEKFGESQEKERRLHTVQTLVLAAAIYVLFVFVDFFLIPDVFWVTTCVRVVLAGFSLGIVVWMFRRGYSADAIDDISGLLIVACYLGWLFSAGHTGDVVILSHYVVFGAMFMLMTGLFFDFPAEVSFRTCAVILVGGILSVFWLPGSSTTYRIALSVFYVGSFATICYVNWKLDRERYQVFLNGYQAELRQFEIEQRGRELLTLSRTDPLTGLDNRRAVDEKLRVFWKDWKRHERTFAIFLLDVDYFKAYNDHFGHQEGDQCLIQIARVFSRLAEVDGGVVGRFGGEEFIYVSAFDDTQSAMVMAETIRVAVEDLHLPHGRRPDNGSVVTISIGAAISHSSQGEGLEHLIEASDRALYQAKDSGRNRSVMYDPSEPPSPSKDENIADLLRKSIDAGLVSMVYQPIVATETGEVVALEALMRLERPDGSSVSPQKFIPIAEGNGQIISLGRWALMTACVDVLVPNRARTVSVNVSVIQLMTPGFALYTAALLGRMNIEPHRLALEVTESQAIDDYPDALVCIGELKRLGVQIWLDDFGTGYAGLSWLRKVDFDVVKVDRTFLQNLSGDRDETMLGDVVRLVRNRGHDVLVEGIENENHLEIVRKFDVRYLQGYHFAAPAGLSELSQDGIVADPTHAQIDGDNYRRP